MTRPPPVLSSNESALIDALRRGEAAAFETLIEQYHTTLVRLAQWYVPDRAVAEEVAQETWLGVLQGIHRFEGRSSLKTWIFRILTNTAKTRGQREHRSLPFSALENSDTEASESAVDPDRFIPDDPEWHGHWITHPRRWEEIPEDYFQAQETQQHLRRAIVALPAQQREVITLRDVEGWTAEEVCNVLGISETNQRVLLHRARAKVRRALERYFDETTVSLR
jgi:RNA polymerase sigma-70 factor (ECF subfamily)